MNLGRLPARRCFARSSHQPFLSPAKRRLTSSCNNGKDKEVPSNSEKIIPIPNGEASLSLFWRRLGPVKEALQSYGRVQKKRPYATQVTTAIVIYLCGDLSAQYIGGEAYDSKRTARNVIIGAVCSIPAYKWYALIWILLRNQC